MCSARGHVRFTPNSDRESGLLQTVMSALPPKADMCGAMGDVRFGPKADIRNRANRERLKAGRVIFAVEADHVAVAEALVAATLLQPALVDDHDAITRAVERLLQIFSEDRL